MKHNLTFRDGSVLAKLIETLNDVEISDRSAFLISLDILGIEMPTEEGRDDEVAQEVVDVLEEMVIQPFGYMEKMMGWGGTFNKKVAK